MYTWINIILTSIGPTVSQYAFSSWAVVETERLSIETFCRVLGPATTF